MIDACRTAEVYLFAYYKSHLETVVVVCQESTEENYNMYDCATSSNDGQSK